MTAGLFEKDQLPIPLSAQIACVERELSYRERLYPKWVGAGRLSRDAAERELDTMRAVLDTLKACRY